MDLPGESNCIASLWKNHTYDRLKLHLPKQFCQLPYFPFPDNFPEYPTKVQFIDYLESYAKHFEITPRFNESVQSAKWLVVATGENAEKVVPEFEGLQDFGGVSCMLVTTNWRELSRKACTGSGLWKFWHGGLSGPLQPQSNSINGGSELGEKIWSEKAINGSFNAQEHSRKTPVLDIGALERIRSGEIRVVPESKDFLVAESSLLMAKILRWIVLFLATGYCSNVPSWLKDNDFFSEDGLPKTPFPNGWKGKAGFMQLVH
ncbi:putative indole-3-pyruvate monooxygenase YUCCA3 [Vitis vinifera]|uniref:indole-3-pyruvate monooxygenase n=1 Tax=Vitis vinifera TaxID=29760 RepID=A0A438IJ52_VITVI|nr:putative indole-3-pyruvate monooxygenase YUCCA3 [Vitis vinifera]